jgi:serine O-acetyltransferase
MKRDSGAGQPEPAGTDAGPLDAADLARVVEALCATGEEQDRMRLRDSFRHILPSREALVEVVEALRAAMFPGYFGTEDLSDASVRFHVGATLDRAMLTLRDQVRKGLSLFHRRRPDDCPQCDQRSGEICRAFLLRLPDVRRMLAGDVQAAFEGDPAATSPEEVIICYPALLAVTNYRLAHELYRLGVPVLPRIITEHAHSVTGIDIHPGAAIGEKFFIDHGTGVVVGETCVIGDRVRIYQGVTLGAKSFPLDEKGNPVKGVPRHPVVEDDVIVYGGATILGRVTIGKGSVIGGNVWLTEDVPAGAHVTQSQVIQGRFVPGGVIGSCDPEKA